MQRERAPSALRSPRCGSGGAERASGRPARLAATGASAPRAGEARLRRHSARAAAPAAQPCARAAALHRLALPAAHPLPSAGMLPTHPLTINPPWATCIHYQVHTLYVVAYRTLSQVCL